MAKSRMTDDMEVGQPQTVRIPSEGEARVELLEEVEQVETVRALDNQSWLDDMAFMEEMVTVFIQEGDENCVDPVPIGVNGQTLYVKRGVEVPMKRYFAEKLGRCKTQRYGNKKVSVNGIDGYDHPVSTVSTFPFQIRRDDNPNGAAWFAKLMREAA